MMPHKDVLRAGDVVHYVKTTRKAYWVVKNVTGSGVLLVTPDPESSGLETECWVNRDGVSISRLRRVRDGVSLPIPLHNQTWSDGPLEGEELEKARKIARDAYAEKKGARR